MGTVAIADSTDTRPQRPNRVAASETTSRAAPMKPSSGRTRGTRCDWYSKEPSNSAFTAGTKPCPRRPARRRSPAPRLRSASSHRIQGDGGADAGHGHDHLQDAADDDGSVRAGADD